MCRTLSWQSTVSSTRELSRGEQKDKRMSTFTSSSWRSTSSCSRSKMTSTCWNSTASTTWIPRRNPNAHTVPSSRSLRSSSGPWLQVRLFLVFTYHFLSVWARGIPFQMGMPRGENMIVLLFGSINSNSTTLQTNWLCIWSTRRQRELRFMILWPSPSPRGKRKSELFPIPFGEMSWSLYSTRSLVVCPGIKIAY